MPTYDYECTTCGHHFEEYQSITAKPVEKCPKCGRKVKRLIGCGAGIIFKGSGFYQTDYRSKEYKEKSKADSPSAPATTPDKDKSKADSPSAPAMAPDKDKK